MSKGTLIKMEPGSPGRGALMHTALTAGGVASRKKEENPCLDKGGHFSHRNFSVAFRKNNISSCPQTAIACGQGEATFSLTHSCSPVNFYSEQFSPVSS